MTSLKKSLGALIEEQVKRLELLDGITEIYINSKEFQNLNPKERELVYKLKATQKELLNTIDKYIKY
jgi:hypothetical protein